MMANDSVNGPDLIDRSVRWARVLWASLVVLVGVGCATSPTRVKEYRNDVFSGNRGEVGSSEEPRGDAGTVGSRPDSGRDPGSAPPGPVTARVTAQEAGGSPDGEIAMVEAMQTFEPVAELSRPRLLRDEIAYVYEAPFAEVEAEAVQVSAPDLLVSETLSPERLAEVGALELGDDGSYRAASGEVLEPIQQVPWPPPKASATLTFHNEDLGLATAGGFSLGRIDRKLSRNLAACGYFERAYYAVPGGFALVTRLEQIEADGSPSDGETRWQLALPGRYKFWTATFWKDLLVGAKGYYRVIVFVVTDRVADRRPENVDPEEAMNWLGNGARRVPPRIRDAAFTPEHRVTVYVYEFERREIEADIRNPIAPGRLGIEPHLKKSGLYTQLVSSHG